MSQFDFGVIDPNSKSGPQLALDLNNFRDALNTLHRGASRPAYAQAGMLWMHEVSSERWDLCLYDGQLDLALRSFNPVTSQIFKFTSSDIDGLDAALSAAVQKDAATTTGAALIPAGSSAQRPATPAAGMLRYNTTTLEFERYQGGKWLALNVMDKALNEAPAVTLPSAATLNIGSAAANTMSVSGTTTITAFDNVADGATRRLVFQGQLTLTHNAASLILPGGTSITTAAGDVVEMLSLGGGNWRCTNYLPAAGRALNREFLSAPQTITSAGLLTLAHGLKTRPKLFRCSVTITTAHIGYAVGDEVEVPHFADISDSDSNTRGISLTADDTNIYIKYRASSTVFGALNKSNGFPAAITNASGLLNVRAWA